MEFVQFEEIRKLSKLFCSAERLTTFLERDFIQWLPKGIEANKAIYEKFVELKLSEIKGKLSELESSAIFDQIIGNYEKLKPRIYLVNILFTYLKNQSSNLLKDCEMELSLAGSQVVNEIREYEHEGSESKEELTRRAAEMWSQYDGQYRIVEHIVIPFLCEFEIIALRAYKSFKESHALLINELSEESLQIDGATERIGELLRLPKDKFIKVITNAEIGITEDGKYKKYSKPTLTVNQIIILFAAIRNTGGISRDINNKVLGYYLEKVTNLSANKIGQGLSNVPVLINDYKNNRDADDGHVVIDYLNKIIAEIKAQIH